MTLGTENPDDFSVPTVSGNRVVLGTVGTAAATLASATTSTARDAALSTYLGARTARATAAAGATADTNKLLAPKMSATSRNAFLSSTSFVQGRPSRTQTFAISNAVFDLQFDSRFKDAHIWQSEVDPLDGSMILSVQTLTPQLAQAIVAAYGVDAVHVRISPQPDSMPTSRNHDTSGGPVYTVRSDGKVAAKGIINGAGGGGSDFYGGALDPCIMWFTDIYQPYYGFPGTLVTS